MNRPFLIVSLVLFSFSCATPDKEKGSATDSLAVDSVHVMPDTTVTPAAADTATIDSVKTAAVFDKTDSSTYYELENYFKDQEIPVKAAEIQVVDSTCAVLIYPTEQQLAQLQAEYGDDFQTVASDNIYYHGMAIQMLDAVNVETITAESRYINFTAPSTSRSWTLDIRKDGAPPWNLIFYHRNKEPEIVPFIDLSEKKIYEYFQIRAK